MTVDAKFYKSTFRILIPIIIQNTISNFVSLLDNIMVGQMGTDQMNAVSISNQLFFVFTLCLWGSLSGAAIFSAQFFGSGD
ncbi:MAG: MATE family efflux transporter, partial [Fibrobacter sp.]|nr:MATE family efflux transporter [Fibrobacter sp.]